MSNSHNFSSRFRKLRKDIGLSQKDFSKLLDFTTNTQVSRFESGLSEPSLKTLRKLSELFPIDLHYLITGEQSPAALQLERDRLKILSDHAKHLGTTLGNLLKEREDRVNELEDHKKRIAKGEYVEPELIETLESEIQAYDNGMRSLAQNIPWVKETIESIIDKK
ncbi:MAG: helix-turn-helix domain-containing protein [Sedimentisphaerales bacterium]|nr:helix-turn-helix domain-containing protein [Sedimentisphaerales bacterium]